MHWAVYAVIAVLAFGVAYASLRPLNAPDQTPAALSPFVVTFIYAIIGPIIYISCFLIVHRGQYAEQFALLTWPRVGWCSLFAVCIVVGNVTYLLGLQRPGAKVSILTAVTSVYPLITLLLDWPEWRQVRWPFAVPGFILISAGVALLGFA